ncbi:hypothetical protein GCM10020295_30550 [Streptomyces cinereospinus]
MGLTAVPAAVAVVHDMCGQSLRAARAYQTAPQPLDGRGGEQGEGLRAETASPPGRSSTTPLTAVGSGPNARPSRAARTGVACCAMTEQCQKRRCTPPVRTVTVTYRRMCTPSGLRA